MWRADARRRGRASALPDIVHVSSVHPWTDNRIHYREAATLAARGYRVHLIAVESVTEGPDVGVTVTTLRRRRRLSRIFVTTAQAVLHALRSGAPVVHLHDPELAWFIPLLRGLGRTVVFDAHEDLPNQVRSKPYVSRLSLPIFVAIARVVLLFAKSSSLIVCATEAIAARFPAEKAVVVHNYPPLRLGESAAPDAEDREAVVVYIGGVGRIRGAVQMIAALEEPKFPDAWRLRMAGSIERGLQPVLENMDGWSRVHYLGQVPPDEARDVLLTARVGLVLFQDNPAHREALPTKMFEYFAAGIPVVASDFDLWRTIIETNDCGLIVDETDPAEIASAIRRYAEEPELLSRHARNASLVAREKLNWGSEAGVLLGAYESLVPPSVARAAGI